VRWRKLTLMTTTAAPVELQQVLSRVILRAEKLQERLHDAT
jgi:hypothetical protein